MPAVRFSRLRLRLRLCLATLVCVTSTAAATASAQEDETYEQRRTREVLEDEELTQVEEAQGSRIAFVRIVRDDVFIEEDGGFLGWLTWANFLHWRTREAVVERELLLEQGDGYDQELAEESMRNLRDLGIFSYVQIVPVVGEREGEVGLLVYTRDLWSLRLENNFQITGSQIDSLLVQLTERNLFGGQKRGTIRFFLVPDTYRLGQVYFDHRLFGGTLSLLESVDLIINRDSGRLEGVGAQLVFRSPFYDLSQRLGFDVRGVFVSEVERRIQNGGVVTYDIPETPEEETIRSAWRQRQLDASARLLLRQGERYKQTFGLGASVSDLHARPNDETGLLADQEVAFRRDVMPRERTQIGPLLTYELFTPTFERFQNLASYGVTESVRTGPHVRLDFGLPLGAFGSSSDSLVFEATYGYVLAGGGALAEASLTAGSRLEDGDVVDRALEAEIRGATPMMGPLRLVGRLTWDGRERDTSRTLVTLGGDNGLRGFVSQALAVTGGNLLRGNIELRTRPLVIWSVHIGAALFYDVGTVYESTDDMQFHHAVGLGVRILVPQFNRLPFRVDAATPLEGDLSIVPSFGATQAVPLTEFEDEQIL